MENSDERRSGRKVDDETKGLVRIAHLTFRFVIDLPSAAAGGRLAALPPGAARRASRELHGTPR